MPNLIPYLLTIPSLTAIVGQRIRPGAINLTNNPYPYVLINLVVTDDDQILSGETDFIKQTIEIQSVSKSYETADSISEIIRLNLNGYQNRTMGNLYINSTIKTNEWTFMDDPKTGSSKIIHIRATIYDISYPIPDNVVHP